MKKLIALATTALLSLNASAGYVQYDFTGPITGFLIQHDNDGSVAFYNMVAQVPMPSLGDDRWFQIYPMYENAMLASTTHFRNGNGPTNFTNYDSNDGTIDTQIKVTFKRSTGGNFEYTANYSAGLWMWDGWHRSTGVLKGLVTKAEIHPSLAASLDYYGGYDKLVTPVVPTYIGPVPVPEPGSLALLTIGLIGAAGLRKRQHA